MNKRKFIKSGLATIGAITIPNGLAENIKKIDPPKVFETNDLEFILKVDPPKIHEPMDIKFFLDTGKLIVSSKEVHQCPYIMEYGADTVINMGNLHEKFKTMFCEQYNRNYFISYYLPSTKSKVEKSTFTVPPHDYTIGQMILIGDIIEDTIKNSSFVIVTPKISTILQIRKSFISSGINRAVFHHDIIGTINETVIYRDVTTENSDYVLTDSHLFSVDLCFPTVKIGDGI